MSPTPARSGRRSSARVARFSSLWTSPAELAVAASSSRQTNAIKGDLQRNQRDRDAYLRDSGLEWSVGRGGILTDEPGGRADIRITPPTNRLSLFRRLARADFARALIAAADSPSASMRMFDVFNAAGSPPTDKELAERLEQLSK